MSKPPPSPTAAANAPPAPPDPPLLAEIWPNSHNSQPTVSSANANSASAPSATETPEDLYTRYAEAQKELARAFRRDLAKATGLPDQPQDDDGGVRINYKRQRRRYRVEDSTDESSSGDENLPPAADPNKPAQKPSGRNKNRRPVVTNGRRSGAPPLPPSMHSNGVVVISDPQDPTRLGHPATRNGMPDEEEDPNSPPRVRASKLEYKRLDELYNKNIHDFYLAESSQKASAKEDKWEEYIFIIRRRFGMFLTGNHWQNKFQKTFVDIKSVELRTVLREVLKDVQYVAGLREDKPTIEPNLLFNYLPELERHLEEAKAVPEESRNKTLVDHLTVLIDYVNSDYESVAKRLYPLLEHEEITFDLLWALFLPNTIIYTVCAGSNEPRCLKLDWGEQKESMQRGRFYQLDCHYVDYDGKSLGEANAVLEIDEFRGARRIADIGAFPLAYHEDAEDVREKLMERGRKFATMKGQQYKYYKGIAFFKRKRGIVRVNIHGRVMIDPQTFRRINPNYRTSPVKSGSSTAGIFGNDSESEAEDPDGGAGDSDEGGDINATPAATETRSTHRSASIGKKPRRSYVIGQDGKMQLVGHGSATLEKLLAMKKAAQKKASEGDETEDPQSSKIEAETMTDEMLLLCSPTVLGFSFGDKLWCEFAVGNCHEIVFNPDAFDSLVLPAEQKTIVRALVENHTDKESSKKNIDDVIKGKGRGMVAVLHGPPGCGKTLTVESIAELLKRPLYSVSSGELGTQPMQLEQELNKILEISHAWGAVLLLDEADVFLERRTMADLHRNSLVSVFLRLLEYFQGILFLTTNRVETFDDAFQSRIHIALRYPLLGFKAKKKIWTMFLGMVTDQDSTATTFTAEEIEWLSKKDLNGRQIKNTVRSAQALATSENKPLAMPFLKTVLGVQEGFENDLKGKGHAGAMQSYI